MATVSITIPDAVFPRVTAAFGASYGYQATLADGSQNPQTLAQFTKSQVIGYVMDVTRAYEANAADATARTAAIAKANSDIVIS